MEQLAFLLENSFVTTIIAGCENKINNPVQMVYIAIHASYSTSRPYRPGGVACLSAFENKVY